MPQSSQAAECKTARRRLRQRVQASEIDNTLADANVVLLDVREAWELEKHGTREGYIHIPLFELEDRLDELPKDKMILTA